MVTLQSKVGKMIDWSILLVDFSAVGCGNQKRHYEWLRCHIYKLNIQFVSRQNVAHSAYSRHHLLLNTQNLIFLAFIHKGKFIKVHVVVCRQSATGTSAAMMSNPVLTAAMWPLE